ncbi:hypothetical protein [Cohaesibacter marisflavi]|uniref:hypothetical protein n=1 Tax=Cohaesibacter marisflavi TaxID=655353 RepID=UPI0029C71880|nr:hypothetical protein [Cohaesibacter marisflavi]
MRKILASVATNLVRIVSLLLATATTMALSLVLVFLVPLFLQFFYQIPKSWNHDGPIATDPIFWAFWLSISFGPAVLAFLVPPIGNWIQDQGFWSAQTFGPRKCCHCPGQRKTYGRRQAKKETHIPSGLSYDGR